MEIKKYQKWVNNQKSSSFNEDEIWKVVDIFHRNRKKFIHQDIYRYDFASLANEAKDKESARRKKYKGAENIGVFDDHQILKLIRLDTFDAVKKYLSNTRICITNKRAYDDFVMDGSIFYVAIVNDIIYKREYQKYIFSCLYNRKWHIEAFDSEDNAISVGNFNQKIIDLILYDLKVTNNFSVWLHNPYKNKEFFQKYLSLRKNNELNKFDKRAFAINEEYLTAELVSKYFYDLPTKTTIKFYENEKVRNLLIKENNLFILNKLDFKDKKIRSRVNKHAKTDRFIKKAITLGFMRGDGKKSEVIKLEKEIEKLKIKITKLGKAKKWQPPRIPKI